MHDTISRAARIRSLFLFLVVAGCGPRPASVGVEGEPGAPAAPAPGETSTPPSGGSGTSGGSGGAATTVTDGGCVVALRLYACCPIPEPAEASAVSADPCFVPYPHDFNGHVTPPECEARRPLNCDDGCGPLNKRPASVFAVRDAQTGACTFGDECGQDADCQLAADARFCCLCTDAWPVSYVAAEACLYPTDAQEKRRPGPDPCRPAECDDDGGGCVGCPTAELGAGPWEAQCVTPRGGSPRRCQVH